MGRSDKAPASGEFVRRQLAALKSITQDEILFSYFEMPSEVANANSSTKRYLTFVSAFFTKYIFSRKKFSILHVHFFFPTILLAIAYKIFRNPRVKIITTFHGNDVYAYRHAPWWYRISFSFVHHSIFVTERLKQSFYNQNISYSVLCAGILPVFKAEAKKVKEYDLIFVGTLNKNKGALRLIELLGQLPDSVSLAVVGTGEFQRELEGLSKNHNVEYFKFSCAEELVNLYQKSKWLINLSYNESFGLVITEAMACGLPVIATKTDGSLSQVIENHNGYIIQQNEKISGNIFKLISETSRYKYNQLSDNAKLSTKKYQLSFVVKEIKKIYLEIIN
ncbi:glycosyltransferase family 4 protein [Litorilituus lipolyticus]|uniref:Glycosyltransferase n=1 Tax=Litorilituus lipolyticus TaxID=2491017 RepID=A0A502L4A6_9GAMM|nr:glycosyltransferase family 4 protein [Litorilituus lipolyticus]TPH17071.1 glycosyltransferase [Litorilituus lipolyticus]